MMPNASTLATSATKPAWRTALLLFVTVASVSLSNGKVVEHGWGGDTIPNRLIPFSILRFGTLTLEPFRDSFATAGGFRWYAQEPKGTLVSFYPVGTSIVALPLYVPLYLGYAANGTVSAQDLFERSPAAEKVVATALSSLCVVGVWLVLRRKHGERPALIVALALAFGTLLWPVASQALWPHTALAFLLVLGYALLSRQPLPGNLVAAGLTFGLVAAVRPPALVFWLAAMAPLALAPGRWRRLGFFLLGSAAPIGLTILYNRAVWGNMTGGYQASGPTLFSLSRIGEGAAGLLFSPNRGAFVFMPIVAFGLIGAIHSVWKWRQDPALASLLVATGTYFLFFASYAQWAAGWSFGPRYLTEILPYLAIAAAPLLPRLRTRWARGVAIILLAWSVAVQASGAYCYPLSNWNGRMSPDLESNAWQWRHFMPWEDFRVWRAIP